MTETTVSPTPDSTPLSADAFAASLREHSENYWHDHPFHVHMHEGRLNRNQIQAWVANRYYYQKSIPIKDAAILANCPDPSIRRLWIARIIYHDGVAEGQGGIAAWLRLAEAVGLRRQDVVEEGAVLPGVRFAVDAYVMFARTRPWVEAVAASLSEHFAPDLIGRRVSAWKHHYPWITPDGYEYFETRLRQAPHDAAQALQLVIRFCTTRAEQQRALDALAFKCDVLWSMLDAVQQKHGPEE